MMHQTEKETTENIELDRARNRACHSMLLRLAASAPAQLLVVGREWLARGRVADLARAVAFAAVHQRLPLTFEDIGLLARLLEEAGVNPAMLAQAEFSEYETFPPYRFGVIGPEQIDEAATEWAARQPALIGLWCSWRVPADGAPWPPGRRVYVAELEAGADPVQAAHRLQEALMAAGEAEPSAEVYLLGEEPPIYQRLARGQGELIWAAHETPVRVAAFGEMDPRTGPFYGEDRPEIDDLDERARLVAYLRSGEPVMTASARLDDVVDAGRRSAVPMGFSTDGRWVWSDAIAYYLAEYGLAPDPELVSHIRGAGYVPSAPDGVMMHRALRELTAPR